jgi:hypothetical protein
VRLEPELLATATIRARVVGADPSNSCVAASPRDIAHIPPVRPSERFTGFAEEDDDFASDFDSGDSSSPGPGVRFSRVIEEVTYARIEAENAPPEERFHADPADFDESLSDDPYAERQERERQERVSRERDRDRDKLHQREHERERDRPSAPIGEHSDGDRYHGEFSHASAERFRDSLSDSPRGESPRGQRPVTADSGQSLSPGAASSSRSEDFSRAQTSQAPSRAYDADADTVADVETEAGLNGSRIAHHRSSARDDFFLDDSLFDAHDRYFSSAGRPIRDSRPESRDLLSQADLSAHVLPSAIAALTEAADVAAEKETQRGLELADLAAEPSPAVMQIPKRPIGAVFGLAAAFERALAAESGERQP